MPLRQPEGILDSLLGLMGLDLKAPDHTTLSRRNQTVEVPPLTRVHDGPISLVVHGELLFRHAQVNFSPWTEC